MALLRAHEATAEAKYLDRARELSEYMLAELKNPAGGFYDIRAQDSAALKLRLTLIEQNGAASSFFLHLAQVMNVAKYRDAAEWALGAFNAGFSQYGVHAAPFGRALGQLFCRLTL